MPSEAESISGFLCRSIDRIIKCLDGLDSTAAAWHPPAPDANSLLAIAAHVLANTEENVLGVVAGQVVIRRHQDEFSDDNHSVEAVRARWESLEPKLEAALKSLPATDVQTPRVHPRRGEITVHDVLLVAVRHAAEHMGQAELTRDLLKAELLCRPSS